jgi:hypothetical protein
MALTNRQNPLSVACLAASPTNLCLNTTSPQQTFPSSGADSLKANGGRYFEAQVDLSNVPAPTNGTATVYNQLVPDGPWTEVGNVACPATDATRVAFSGNAWAWQLSFVPTADCTVSVSATVQT